MPNWLDGERIDTLRVQLINPTDYGYVGSVKVTDASITEGYYTDTRVQGTIDVLDADNYVPLSMIRLIHEADFSNGEHYKKVLGTFFAMRSKDTWKSGSLVTRFELKSVLYGMSKDISPLSLVFAKGSFAQAAYNDICNRCNRKRRWIKGANNKRFAKNLVLELGDDRLTWLHRLASVTTNRVDCDENGYVTMSAYIPPSRRTPKMKLPYNSPLVLASGIDRESDFMEVPMRAIVTWEHSYDVLVEDGVYKSNAKDSDGVQHYKGEKKYKKKKERATIVDYAEVDAGNQAHINRRGFRVASWHSEDDLGDSQAVAQALAKAYLDEESKPTVTWKLTTRWFEVYQGDVLSWKPSDSEAYRKVLVTDCDKNLSNFTISLELKEV